MKSCFVVFSYVYFCKIDMVVVCYSEGLVILVLFSLKDFYWFDIG